MRGRILLVAAALLAPLALHATLVLTAAPMLPLVAEPTLPDAAEAPVDDVWWIAYAFAPWLYHETHGELGRQDIPAAMDFDGDRDARDNWEELPRYEIVPTLYYTVVETGTHYVVSYHLYHPRDWVRVPLGTQDTHEGDGENVQIVVSKETMEPVLVSTQAHYRMWSYAPFPGGVRSGAETLRGGFELLEGHPAVYVESGGHGIYGALDPRAANRLWRQGEPVVSYKPAAQGEPLAEPRAPWNETVLYRLVSLPGFLANSTDHPTLFAGEGEFEGRATPRYHAGDRYSGPLGASRGISPFAVGYGWSRGELGSLFWEPGERYAQALDIRGNWSTEVVAHPFR